MGKPFYEPGAFIGEVVQQGLTKASTGNTQFVLRFKVVGKPDPNDPDTLIQCAEYERTIYMTITDKTATFVVDNLHMLGYRAESFGPLDPSHANHQSFVGQQIEVYCQHEQGQSGDMREKWQLSRKPQAIEIKPLEAKEVRQLDMLFGKALKAGTPSTPKQTQAKSLSYTAVLSDGTEITDDDIPF